MASLINFTIPSILSIRLKKWTNSWLNYMLIGIKRSEEHTSELQSRSDLVCRLLLEKKKNVVVAIPAFNEGPTIGSVVLKARQFASEVVVVDDGSTDDTAETAPLAGAPVIRHAGYHCGVGVFST